MLHFKQIGMTSNQIYIRIYEKDKKVQLSISYMSNFLDLNHRLVKNRGVTCPYIWKIFNLKKVLIYLMNIFPTLMIINGTRKCERCMCRAPRTWYANNIYIIFTIIKYMYKKRYIAKKSSNLRKVQLFSMQGMTLWFTTL